MPIRVVVFEDNDERRESLKYLLSMYSDIYFAGAFVDCSIALENVRETNPDVVLMDIQMPNVDGIAGVKILKSNFPNLVIIMQTIFEDDEKIFDSIQAGASGYILKKAPPEKIIEAIRDAYAGGSPMTPAIAARVLKYFQQNTLKNDYELTQREKEMLALLVDGHSYKMIADKCSISFHTVNAHLRKIYEKLHVHSVGEAVSKALRERLV
ncbi:MAG: response regulator transcription factor [Bacteroidales bacterium]